MNIFKKYLAMFLAICMLLSVLPMTAWANETEGTEDSAGTEAPVDAQTPSDEEAPADSGTSDEVTVSEDSQEETEAQDEASQEETEAQDEASQEETEAQDEENGEDIPVVLADTDPVPGHMATKPGDGETTGEPFPQGTAGSNSFRIPALVTLSDGTLVAAADARWNTTYDGGGLDTIVARSSDNGTNWDYTFANYLGDNGNTYNGSGSTAFIDPALAVTANDTIYMLVDLYPYGIALNGDGTQTAPKTDVGFNDAGKLLLSMDNHASYGYYLDGNTIKAADGTVQNGYYVDAYFNLYTVDGNGNKTYASNLFFSDSAFKVVRTGYLYLTKSTDKGATWSEPTLLDLKTENEMVCLVGPGRGLVTGSGMIVFPTYSYHGDNDPSGNTQRLSFVYSTDGVNWSRTAELNYNWASEAAVVELKDGNLRFFFRNGTTNLCYVDYNVTGNTWGTPVTMTDIDTNSNCQISAVTYSKTIDGKQVILVSCPTGANSAGDNSSSASARLNGKIFAFTVNADGSMTKVGDVSVTSNNSQFMYSCLTELKNNSVGILYEDLENAWGAGNNCYYTMSYGTYDPAAAMNLTFDTAASGGEENEGNQGNENNEGENTANTVYVNLKVGESKTETINGVNLNGNHMDDYATVTWVGTEAVVAQGTRLSDDTVIPLSACEFTFTKGADGYYVIQNGSYYLNQTCSSAAKIPCVTTPGKVAIVEGQFDEMFQLKSQMVTGSTYNGTPSLHFHTELSTPYWNRCGNDTTIKCHEYLYRAVREGEASSAEIPGYVRITELSEIVSGESYLIAQTNGNGYYVLYPESVEGKSIVKVKTDVTVTPAQTTVSITGNKVGTTTAVVGNTTYHITVTAENVINVELMVGDTKEYTDNTGNYQGDANNVAPNGNIATMDVVGTTTGGMTVEALTSLTAGAANTFYIQVSEGTYLTNDCGTTTNIDEAALWYANFANNNYCTVRNVATTYYLGVGYDGKIATTQNTSYTKMSDGKLVGYYSNNEAGTPVKVTGAPAVHETTITFEGIAPGTTYAVVGNTQYNITVISQERTVDIELEVGETFTHTDTTGNYVGTQYTQPDGTYATMDVKGASAATRTPVTAIESGKRYLIVNKNTGEILTDTAAVVTGDWGNRDGLATIPEANAQGLEWWTITESNGKYTLAQDGRYLAVAGFVSYMYDTETLLTLTYTDNGWTIYDNTTWAALGHGEANYYLSDSVGDNYSGSAQGTSDTNNAAIYWDIIEIPHTDVTFTGIAPGTTTAKVGSTTYNITVVEPETDDEVEHTATRFWTVDPEVQTQRITDATVENTGYTDESWEAYEEALTAANDKLAEITEAAYTSPEAAQAALEELTALTDALEAAKNGLVPGKAITIRYWRLGTMVKEETIHIPANYSTYDLEPTKTVNGETYTLSPSRLNMAGNVTEFDIQLLQEYDATSGIMGKYDVNASVAGRPVNEMTVTVGITYDLDLADILADGETIEWSSGNTDVATVGADGIVTAVGEGTTTITATVKNGDTVVKSYEIPITVLPSAGDVPKRTVAVYVDNIDNTTVYCVLHANNTKWEFEVAEGELIYGQFQKDDGSTSTGAETVTGLTFFGKPNDQHALVYMSSTNSAGEYFSLHDADGKVVLDENGTPLDPVNGKYYYANKTSGAAKWLAIGLSGNQTGDIIDDTVWKTEIVAMAQKYADAGYDGVLGFTKRTTEGDQYTNLSFVSDPMPVVDKTVDGVLPTGGKLDNYQRYVEDMVAAVDEVVFFKITVTLERPTIWVMQDGAPVRDAEGLQTSAITYTDSFLRDTALENADTSYMDAYFYTKDEDQEDGVWDGQFENNRVNVKEITDALNEGWADDEQVRVLEYYVVYKIQEKDIPKFNIENTVSLEYDYTSVYSSGALTSTADAKAKITVIGVAMDNVVIDFGQSFVYDGLTNRHLKGVFVNGANDDGITTTCKATAKYGTVTVVRTPILDENGDPKLDGNNYPEYTYTVTYTPTSILQGPDMVLLYGIGENNQEKVINGFIVYPATTVYYEEGFAFPAVTNPGTHTEWDMTTDGNWNLNNSRTATVFQTFERLGRTEVNGNVYTIHSDKAHPYGFDPVYNGNDTLNGSYAETSTVGAKTRFVFTGDGIQIFAKCTDDPSGYVSVEVREATAPYKIVRLAMVNTKVLAGTTNATTGQTGDMDGLPVVSLINIEGMDYGQYIVTITKVLDNRPVYIDGFRVFNTVESKADSSPFTIDLEDQPEFYELRDAVLHALEVDADTSEDYDKLAEQIYNEINGASALITGEKVDYASDATAQDLLDNGPKNELFLYPGQTLTFIVSTDRTMQVGLKTPRGTTKALVTVNDVNVLDDTTTDEDNDGRLISSSVDMFYPLVTQPTGTETSYTVKITNNGSDILSVTLLKICDDPNAAFTQLTKEDIESILTGAAKPVTILSQPADTAVAMGERFNVEVIAQGEGLKYQWYFRNAGETVFHKSGVRDNTYDDVMTAARAGREVYCVITDAAGNSVTTDTARIDVIPNIKLEILQQPADQIVDLGERFNAEVIAQGEGLKYQWYFRNAGETIFHKSGVRDNTYDDVMTVARNGREVYCVITDAFGNTVTTDTVKLIANPGEVLKIVQQPGNAEAKLGENFMVEVIAQGEGLRYQWFYRNAGGKTFVKSGVRDNTYDDVMTAARAGREVYCVITDAYGNTVTTDTVKLIAIPTHTLAILQQPANAEAKLGENFMVEVIAQGDGLRYQWFYRNAGETIFHKSGVRDNTYDDVMTTARAGREVYCVITDAFGNTVTTDTVKLVALPSQTLEILQQPRDAEAKLGENFMVEVIAQGDGLRYRWYFRNRGQSVWHLSSVRDNTYDDVMTAARAGREVYCVITDAFGNTVTTEIVRLICTEMDVQMVVQN